MTEAVDVRLFVAAEVPVELREALAETSAALRGCVRGRFVGADSLHVTLAFLGEVAGARVEDASAALERGCRRFSGFDVELGELGCFGKRSKATLWQGFRDAGALPEIAESVRRELRAVGFAFDEKAFLPHVTLMRTADLTSGTLPVPVCTGGPGMSEGVVSVGRITTVTLFRSDLSGKRPVYEPLHSVELT